MRFYLKPKDHNVIYHYYVIYVFSFTFNLNMEFYVLGFYYPNLFRPLDHHLNLINVL